MSIRVSESWTARNGHRRSVSVNLGTYVAGSLALCFSRGLAGLFLLPFVLSWWVLLLDLWICAELLLFTASGIAVTAAVLKGKGRGADITLKVIRWHLLVFGLKGVRK